jgi:hypothetical protein
VNSNREVFLDPQQVDGRTSGRGTKFLPSYLASEIILLSILTGQSRGNSNPTRYPQLSGPYVDYQLILVKSIKAVIVQYAGLLIVPRAGVNAA